MNKYDMFKNICIFSAILEKYNKTIYLFLIVKQLDAKDHKLLYELYLNSRQSLSKLCKKIGISNKSLLKYRIDRLEKEGIMKRKISLIASFVIVTAISIFLILSAHSHGSNQTPNIKSSEQVNSIEQITELPLYFEPNVGQSNSQQCRKIRGVHL